MDSTGLVFSQSFGVRESLNTIMMLSSIYVFLDDNYGSVLECHCFKIIKFEVKTNRFLKILAKKP